MLGLTSPLLSEVTLDLTENAVVQSAASTPGRDTSEIAWLVSTGTRAFRPHPAATVRLSKSLFLLPSSSRTAVPQIACHSGPGKYRLTTPVGTLECWPVAAPARLSLYQGTVMCSHRTLGDPGLEAPPRLETSIPAATSPYAEQRCSHSSQPLLGMHATLATGEGYCRISFLSHSAEAAPSTGLA